MYAYFLHVNNFRKFDSCRERVDRPFRCLDYEYRRELVTVFANLDLPLLWFVEGLRRMCIGLIEDKLKWKWYSTFILQY